MRKISFYLIVVLPALTGYFPKAQMINSHFVIKTYTAQEGLPHSYIYTILQDSKGYLWVGTRYGLCRFDGQYFSSITINDEVKNIPLGSLIEDEKGGLNILSAQELYYLDSKKTMGLVRKGSYFPLFFIPEKGVNVNNGLWTFGNDSIYSLNGLTARKITPVPEISTELCRQVFETDSSWYYNFLDGFLIAGKNGEIKNIGKLLPSSRFIVAMGFWNKQFYLYTDKGIYTYSNNSIRTLFKKQLFGKHIYAAYRDKKNRMWIGTDEDGILVSQPGQEEILTYSIKLSHNLISGFYEDKEGNMWIAGFEGLIKVQEKNYETFSGKDYMYLTDLNLVTKDNAGTMFFFSERNGYSNWHLGQFSFNSGNLLKGQLIDVLCRDEKNRFWCISRQNKLILFNRGQIKFIDDHVLNSADDLQPDIVYDNSRKKLWVPGMQLLLGDEKGFEIFKDRNSKPILNPRRILMVGDRKIIVATSANELLLINQDNIVRKVSVPKKLFPDKIHRFFSDSSGNIWISYLGTGLLQCRLQDDSSLIIITQFTRENGLNNDVIQSMVFDKQGRIWLSTMAGITVIDFKNKTANSLPVYLFGKDEGIPASGLEYGRLSCDISGDIWYCTQNALMKFRVSELHFNNQSPHVGIENVLINNKETNWKKYTDTLDGVFQIPVNPVMNYTDNILTISFKAATMTNADLVQYSYLLSGTNNYWSNSSKNNTITFTKLNPGKYTFFVRARTNSMNWCTPALFTFSIRKPYWQQWWFIALLVLAGAGFIFIVYRIRIRQLRKEKKIRDQIASDLHDDLGSTLNSVKVYANVASIENDNKQYLEKIKESTQEAITSVRDIIWVLDEKKDTIEHLVTRISQFALPLCGAKHIQFVQEVDDSLYNYILDREEKRNLFMIIKEAITNSIKYADCKIVSLIITEEKKKLVIQITDNGIGYIDTKPNEGHGLKNIQSRSAEIHYRVNITSLNGTGTEIKLEKK